MTDPIRTRVEVPHNDDLIRKVADALKSVPNGPVNDIWHRGITSDADFDHIARAVLAALGNPHERVAELEDLQAAAAEYVLTTEPLISRLLRDLKAIETRVQSAADELKYIGHAPPHTHAGCHICQAYRMLTLAIAGCHEAAATDKQLGPENNQIAT